MHHYLCVTCAMQYGERETPPERCTICDDDRQYVNLAGQQWTTLTQEQGRHTNILAEIAPGIVTISTEPKLGIGERAHLLRTEHGNILWDCIAYLDDATIAAVRELGGIAAIAISHPHFFSTMVEWSRAVGGAPIYLHADHAPWVMRPDAAIHFWEGESVEVLRGVTMLRCGGHFPGSSVLHWPAAEDGQGRRGALFTGDTIKVVADPRFVTFMYSYPNDIPLDARTVRAIADVVEPLPFARLYDGWTTVTGDAKEAVRRSADRYIAHVQGTAGGA
jgi:glyoxylase-like metal-dependent hydrolase (beta-lactamase superfamily II)